MGTMTARAVDLVRRAKYVLGAKRMLAEVESILSDQTKTLNAYASEVVLPALAAVAGEEGHAVLLASGDVGFYSVAISMTEKLLAQNERHPDLAVEVELVPGISSLQYFSAKLGSPWNAWKLISAHGRSTHFVDSVRRNRYTFLLTGGNVPHILETLAEYGYADLTVAVGENLGMQEERIYQGKVSEVLEKRQFPSLTVLLVYNPDASAEIRTGIADQEFSRGDVPMTKAEIRAVVMSKLRIRPSDHCFDVGCGTGSVTVEMALSAYEGSVRGFDVVPEAVELTKQNAKKFRVSNLDASEGRAPECFEGIPAPDVAFIGGSRGEMRGIVAWLAERNPQIRLAVTAITLESALEAIRAFEASGLQSEVIQVSIARARKVGNMNMLEGLNPIFVISTK